MLRGGRPVPGQPLCTAVIYNCSTSPSDYQAIADAGGGQKELGAGDLSDPAYLSRDPLSLRQGLTAASDKSRLSPTARPQRPLLTTLSGDWNLWFRMWG